MLKHLKIVFFEQNSSRVFTNTDIKGGVAISYRNIDKIYEPIGTFISEPKLISIVEKVKALSPSSIGNFRPIGFQPSA